MTFDEMTVEEFNTLPEWNSPESNTTRMTPDKMFRIKDQIPQSNTLCYVIIPMVIEDPSIGNIGELALTLKGISIK